MQGVQSRMVQAVEAGRLWSRPHRAIRWDCRVPGVVQPFLPHGAQYDQADFPENPRYPGLRDRRRNSGTLPLAEVLPASEPNCQRLGGRLWRPLGPDQLSARAQARRAVPGPRCHGRHYGPLIPALPWLLGFARDRRARNFFLGLAAITVVVTALTDWTADTSRA